MLVDYLHKRKFPILGPIATWTLRTATVGVLVGVYQFNTNDIGAYRPFLLSGWLCGNDGRVLICYIFLSRSHRTYHQSMACIVEIFPSAAAVPLYKRVNDYNNQSIICA